VAYIRIREDRGIEGTPRRCEVLAQLIEKPRQIVGAAMIVAIRKRAPPMGAAILLIVAAE